MEVAKATAALGQDTGQLMSAGLVRPKQLSDLEVEDSSGEGGEGKARGSPSTRWLLWSMERSSSLSLARS